MKSIPNFVPVANANNQLDRPTDLDFFPILGKDELWVINQRTESDGGSTLTISDASKGPSDMQHKVDGNAWHFMSLPTAIAFSDDNYNFATSPGVLDANHNGGTFTGPTLWSSDPLIYAQPSGGNGSHLDMLHGSPLSMGIAHEKDNVFWIYDNYNNDIVRYDFVDDHGPGNDDHADGIVRRYKSIGISADGDIPNHMLLHKESNWLYFVDNGNDRVMRLDINSGVSSIAQPLINEPLAEHSRIFGFTVETIIEGLDQPCGLEIIDNLLLIGEYGLGDIIVFDMDNNFVETGRIETGAPGLTGIKIGPKGNIWFTNRILNTLTKAEAGDLSSSEDILLSKSVRIFPNPSQDFVNIILPADIITKNSNIEITDITGRKMFVGSNINHQSYIDLTGFTNGIYVLSINTPEHSLTKKFIVQN
jgi:hypothetical protein